MCWKSQLPLDQNPQVLVNDRIAGDKPRVGHIHIFMGYNETSKAYQIFIPSKWRVVISRDVKFEEERAYRRSRGYDERES